MSRFKPQQFEVVIDKLVHGGRGIGTLESGKKALVWNVLPGERVVKRVAVSLHLSKVLRKTYSNHRRIVCCHKMIFI